MSEMVACCGIVCGTCPIFLATRVEDKEEQRRMRCGIARLCREHYGMEYQVEDISDCDGCTVEGGRLFKGCSGCSIRKCALEKRIANCAQCQDYVCANLQALFDSDPAAKTRLDAIRSGIQ